MSRQAQVGVFALLGLLLLFGVFYVITDYGTRHNGYRIGVHFESAAGIATGALVYFSGVTVGSVDSIQLLPDNTVSVILAINRDVSIPKQSRFLIQAPLTGSPSLLIIPPRPIPGVTPSPSDMLARQVLPVDQQVKGTNTATLGDLMEQGQGEVRKLDALLSDLSRREPHMLDSLQKTLDNANSLTVSARTQLAGLTGQMRGELAGISSSVQTLTNNLNQSLGASSPKLAAILDNLDSMTVSLNKSARSLQDLATNPKTKADLTATAENIRITTANIAGLTHDLRQVTGNPATQAQLQNTIANVDAATQRTNSLLGQLGGTSCVYGVDACGTPPPGVVPNASPNPPPPGVNASPYPPPPYPQTGTTPPPNRSFNVGNIMRSLIALQVRASGLSAQTNCCLNPILSSNQGPQVDMNAVLLPANVTSFIVGANNIGYHTTANVVLMQRVSPHLHLGGGVLYSQPGVIGQYNTRSFGVDARLYDPLYPMLDIYGNVNVMHGLQLFAGERDIFHNERRTAYGLQFQF